MSLSSVFNKLQGQPDSYEKKARYRLGRTLGAGTYGIVREALGPAGKVAIKIILKKNVRGNEKMVYDELDMLQRLHHPHIVTFHDWFESKDKYYIVTQLATGGELFDRICDYGKFTEKDASQTIRQVLDAVGYLHRANVVHRDLKPENLLYVTTAADAELVLADFGIAKHLDNASDKLTSMAGSFGYAAPEVMLREPHGKAVDMWSLGVITYTLLCGYSPFRSESMNDLIEECRTARIVFHERYWRDVSEDAKNFILTLLQPDPNRRATSGDALEHRWLKGETATDHNLLPELRAYMAKARLKRGIEIVKLANRIEALKIQQDDDEDLATGEDIPSDTGGTAVKKTSPLSTTPSAAPAAADTSSSSTSTNPPEKKEKLAKAARSAIFREVVLAKVREMKQQEQQDQVERDAIQKAEHDKSGSG